MQHNINKRKNVTTGYHTEMQPCIIMLHTLTKPNETDRWAVESEPALSRGYLALLRSGMGTVYWIGIQIQCSMQTHCFKKTFNLILIKLKKCLIAEGSSGSNG